MELFHLKAANTSVLLTQISKRTGFMFFSAIFTAPFIIPDNCTFTWDSAFGLWNGCHCSSDSFPFHASWSSIKIVTSAFHLCSSGVSLSISVKNMFLSNLFYMFFENNI